MLFADDLIVNVEDPKERIKMLLELSEFHKVTGYKVYIQNQLYFYVLATKNYKIKLKNFICSNVK